MSNLAPFFSFQTLPEDAGLTFGQVLGIRCGLSRSLARRLRVHGDVRADGESVRMIDRVQPGQMITLYLPETRHSYAPEPMSLNIVYEDPHIIVVTKPAGMLVHPTGNEQTGTLANGIAHYMDANDEPSLAGPVTRLDRDTSGLVLFAKHPHAHFRLARDFEAGRVDRVYVAIVEGQVKAEAGVIDAPIRRVQQYASEREVGEGGQCARTSYRVLQRFGAGSGIMGASCLQAQLETGRTHQIRVHCAYLGHPILGDAMYGRILPGIMERQALHAVELRFPHPIDRTELHFSSPLPDDMQRLCDSLAPS